MVLDRSVLQALINASPDGVLVCDVRTPNWAIADSNETLLNYNLGFNREIIGKSLQELKEADLPGIESLVQAVRKVVETRRKDQLVLQTGHRNKLIYQFNESTKIHVTPIFGETNQITHVACFYRALTSLEEVRLMEVRADTLLNSAPSPFVSRDRQTGLMNKEYFDDQLRRDFYSAQQQGRPLSIFLFGINYAAAYKEVFGISGAELTFKRVVAAVAGCFRRDSDLCVRVDESRVLAATLTTQPDQAHSFARSIQARIRDLAIHHPRAVGSRYLTLSVSLASRIPELTDTVDSFISSVFEESDA
jgi:hypothetical protein